MDRSEHQLLLNVAVMYYLEDKNQSEIAKELFVSRSKVSRLLKKAREKRIVEININYKSEELDLLQEEIKERFGIKNVYITKTVNDEFATLKEVSKLAAKELGLILHDGMDIGISWGRHLGMTVRYLPDKDYQGINIVEMFGAMRHHVGTTVDAATVGKRICEKLNAKLYPLMAPIYISDTNGRNEVMSSSVVKETIDKIYECDMVITSLGTIESDNLQTLWHNYLESDMREEVKKHDGAGFILAHFFNRNGRFIDSKINESVVGIQTDRIKEMNIFAIASGEKKAPAILGALRGGLMNTLVSDEKTIRKVLELDGQ